MPERPPDDQAALSLVGCTVVATGRDGRAAASGLVTDAEIVDGCLTLTVQQYELPPLAPTP